MVAGVEFALIAPAIQRTDQARSMSAGQLPLPIFTTLMSRNRLSCKASLCRFARWLDAHDTVEVPGWSPVVPTPKPW